MIVQNTRDRRKVEAIRKWSLALVQDGKAKEILNWDKVQLGIIQSSKILVPAKNGLFIWQIMLGPERLN